MAEETPLITAQELQTFAAVRRANVTTEFLEECALESTLLVRRFVGSADVPGPVLKRAVKEVGKNLVARKTGLDGSSHFDSDGLEVLRVTRDPLQAARAFLLPYLGPAIA